MPLILTCLVQAESGGHPRSEVKVTDSELIFVSFSYKILLLIKEMVLLLLPPKEV